jgi:branched-chain amino acid transport system substrate-binding protein
MKKRVLLGVLGVGVVATLAIVATALGSASKEAGVTVLPSSSCGKLQYGGSGSPQFIIASDLPLQGANRPLTTEMARAIAFLLKNQGWKAGKYNVGYQSCDDATAQKGSWDSSKCTANANQFARNSSVIAVIGTFNSGCAKLEIPIANRAPRGPLGYVSPANTYPGLTVGGPGTAPGEPKVYYPTGKRNYARVVWTDQFQGAADGIFAKQTMKMKSVFILTDKETYGNGIARLFQRAAKKLGIQVKGFKGWDANATSYESLATSVKSSGAQAVFLGGIVCLNGGKLIKDLRSVLGKNFPMLLPDGFTPFSATNSTSGGTSAGAYISYPGIPIDILKEKTAGGRFVRGFTKANGGKVPDPYTAYAAQAAQVVLTAIGKSDGTRASVTSKFFGLKVSGGILGNFTLDKNGDTTLGTVTFGRLTGKGDSVKFVKLITPSLKFVKG